MAQDWDIRPRADTCVSCQQAFADGTVYCSVLVFGTAGYARQDYCDACWKQQQAGSATHSAWRAVYRLPPPPAEEPLKKENAETLLRKLMEDGDPARGNVIYILAVMLERKKVLLERDVQVHDGVLTRTYEHKLTGEAFVVVDPRLRLDELESVQTEVVTLLGGRVPGAPAAPPAPVAP